MQNKENSIVLIVAAEIDYKEIATSLVQARIRYTNLPQVLKELLESGADLNVKDHD